MTRRGVRKAGRVLVVLAALVWAAGVAGSAGPREMEGIEARLFAIPEGRLLGDVLSVALTEEYLPFTDLRITVETQGPGTYSGHVILFDLGAFEAQDPGERSLLPRMIVARVEFSDTDRIITLAAVSPRPSAIGILLFAEESNGLEYRLSATSAGAEDPPFIPVRLADSVPVRPILEWDVGYAVQVPALTVRDHTIILRALMENFAGPGGILGQLDLCKPELTADDILEAALAAERINERTKGRIRAVRAMRAEIGELQLAPEVEDALDVLRGQLAETESLAEVIQVIEAALRSPLYDEPPALRHRLHLARELVYDGSLTIYSAGYAPNLVYYGLDSGLVRVVVADVAGAITGGLTGAVAASVAQIIVEIVDRF